MASMRLRFKQVVSVTLTTLLLLMTVLPTQVSRAAEATVVITSPTLNQNITTNSNNTVQVTGYVNNIYPDGLTVVAYPVGQTPGASTQVNYQADGSFSTSVVLGDGVNVIEVTGNGPEGSETKSVTVNYQTGAPIINVTNPTGDTQTVGTVPFTITGTVYNGSVYSATVDGKYASVSNQTGTNQWTCVINTMSLGLNKVIITARNSSSGKTTTKELYITYDNAPNVLNLSPTNNSIVDSANQTLTGTLVNTTKVQLSINGGAYTDIPVVGQTLNYNVILTQQGINKITLKIYNGSQVTTKTLNITYYAGTPHIYNVAPTSSVVYSSTVQITGSVLYADQLEINLNGTSTIENVTGQNFAINVSGLQLGPNTIIVTPLKAGSPGSSVTMQVRYDLAPKITLTGALNYEAVGSVTKSVYWNDRLLTLAGEVKNTTQLTLDHDGVQTTPTIDGLGRFTSGLTLKDGVNVIKLTARNNTSSSTELILLVEYRFNGQGAITFTQPTNVNQVVYTNETKITFEGQVTNIRYLSVQVNDGAYQSLAFDSQGKFKREVTLIGGLNTINFRGENNLGYIPLKTIKVYFTQTPEITITTPKDNAEIKNNTVVVSGKVKYCDTDGLTINDQKVSFSSYSGDFSKEISINPDQTQIVVKAKRGDVEITKTVPITYKGTPEIYFFQPTDKSQVYSNVLSIRGQIRGVAGELDKTELTINNKTVSTDVYGNFSSSTTIKLGSNTISANAKLANKKTLSKSIKVTYVDLAMTGARVETTVPMNGATVKLFEGNFELKVPKNGFYRETAITTTIEESDDYNKDSEDTLYVGNIYEIDGLNPEKPLTLTLKYVTGIKDVQASNIGIYRYDDDDDEWVPIGGKVDAKKGTVTAEINELGTYTVMAYIKTFNDIRGHWAQKDIEIMLAKGIANGRWGYRFAPDEEITRAEFVKMLVKATGIPIYEETEASFYDVDEDDWSFDYVQAAVRAGVVKGTASGRFNPDKNITRAEAATMVARAANLANSGQSSLELLDSFKDKKQIATYAQGPIAGVVKAGLFKGMADGTFRPGDRTTRAQTAKMLVRLMTLERRL